MRAEAARQLAQDLSEGVNCEISGYIETVLDAICRG